MDGLRGAHFVVEALHLGKVGESGHDLAQAWVMSIDAASFEGVPEIDERVFATQIVEAPGSSGDVPGLERGKRRVKTEPFGQRRNGEKGRGLLCQEGGGE